tara:strand:- start:333 stop:758 length:426 start_codon:yes stop_codon:yes gene_type:complete
MWRASRRKQIFGEYNMALNWDLGDIENFKSVCRNEDESLREETELLIFYTMNLGMGLITQNNVDKFILRFRMYEVLYGMAKWRNVNGQRINAISDTLIRKHIGLHTNASSISDAQFNKNMLKQLVREAEATSENIDRRQAA